MTQETHPFHFSVLSIILWIVYVCWAGGIVFLLPFIVKKLRSEVSFVLFKAVLIPKSLSQDAAVAPD